MDRRGTSGETDEVLRLGGYTIIEAENLEEATRLANGCPLIRDGGAVEVERG